MTFSKLATYAASIVKSIFGNFGVFIDTPWVYTVLDVLHGLWCGDWCRYKGSRELAESDKFSMSKDGDTYVLVINDVFGEDADEYCVKATTPAGSRASRADLVIKSTSTSLVALSHLLPHHHYRFTAFFPEPPSRPKPGQRTRGSRPGPRTEILSLRTTKDQGQG